MDFLTPMVEQQTGYLMPIGGAEDKRRNREILTRFVELCGGRDARLAVLPMASSFPEETATTYCDLFSQLGAASVDCLHIRTREQANRREVANRLRDVTGVFMSGGDQLRLLSLIGATRFADELRAAFLKGAHVAGTSAGASAMSRHMIGFGRSGAVPSQRMVQMALGLGLTESLIIDQHFSQRQRLGRLTTAVALCPGLVGVGIDEDTALPATRGKSE